MAGTQLDIPSAWEHIELAGLRGTLMVIGAPDVGKSTFAQYLYRHCVKAAESRCVAYLDGDPGQSTLGPPSTMTLTVGEKGDDAFPPRGPTWRSFVGAVSPRGHMLPVLVGAARLAQAAQEAGAEVVIYDTSGLVDPAQGGAALKLAKIDLLRPSTVFVIQRELELEPLLAPLRRSHRVRVVDLHLSPAIRPRDSHARQAYRASQFARYFTTVHTLTVNWEQLAIVPPPKFIYHRLAAFEDAAGFTLGLGVIQVVDFRTRQATLLTPLQSLDRVDMLRLGDLTLELQTFRDQPLT
jgi:polynucleotide 5'-hydroxyl-kinase GRC3/NOL9